MKEQKEKHKIIVMAILLGICCALTYYFHAILEIETVFTHFFYIPIILACLWWKRKGVVIAIFLAALLIFSHTIVRVAPPTGNDCLRALMLIAIGTVVAILSEMIAKVQTRITHLNAVLRSIRNVNQLLVMEKDSESLIQRTCKSLTDTRGYYNTWIALLDESGRVVATAEDGFGEDFLPVKERAQAWRIDCLWAAGVGAFGRCSN